MSQGRQDDQVGRVLETFSQGGDCNGERLSVPHLKNVWAGDPCPSLARQLSWSGGPHGNEEMDITES